MFSILNRKVQNSIVKSSNDLYKIEYNQVCFLNERFIETFLKVSTNFRNAAGHNEKFYSFTAKDSIVKRDVYSNVQVNKHSFNNLFDYQIPSSAKLVNPINMPK